MKRNLLKKILGVTVSITVLAALVLGVHIYMVTRPGKADATTVAMGRIDIKDEIDAATADEMVAWFYEQQGVQRAVYNAASQILVFTYRPAILSTDILMKEFRSNFNYTAEQYKPTEEEMKKGCPVNTTTAFKATDYFKELF